MWRCARKGTLGWSKSASFKFLHQSTVFEFLFYEKLSIWKSIFFNLRFVFSRTVSYVDACMLHILTYRHTNDALYRSERVEVSWSETPLEKSIMFVYIVYIGTLRSSIYTKSSPRTSKRCKRVWERFEFRILAEFLIVGAEIEDSRNNTAQTRKATR